MRALRRAALLIVILALAAPALAAQKAKAPAPAPAPDPDAQALTEFFRQEAEKSPRTLDFKIEGGYADIRTEAAESSGRYFLAGHSITAVATDIYRLDLTFKRKFQRDVIDLTPEYFFTQQRSYYFWYGGGMKIVFKVGSARKEVKIPRKESTEI